MAKKRKNSQASGPGSSKKRQHTGKGGKPHKVKPQQDVPLPSVEAEQHSSDDLDVSDEDLQFVQQYGQQLGFLKDLNPQELDKAIKAKQQKAAAAAVQPDGAAAAAAGAGGEAEDAGGTGADESDEEAAEYERRPRAAEQQQSGPSTQGLPVKTSTGELVFVPNKQQQRRLLAASRINVEGVTVTDEMVVQQQQQQQGPAEGPAAGGGAEEAAEEEEGEGDGAAAHGKGPGQLQQQQRVKQAAVAQPGPPALLSLMSIANQAARRDALKQQMALTAQHLLAEPEKHIGAGLRLLSACASDADGVVVRLALLSLLAVFKDLLPGYRIRSATEEEEQVRVSKEVAALREYEAALLKGYQAYLRTLLAAATAKPSPGSSNSARLATARVAVRCMGQLLVAKPGFNYSSDLLQALVPQMVCPDSEVAQLATDALTQLLASDTQAKTSLEAVQLVADLVRHRRCVGPPSLVSCLLVLRFTAVTPIQQGGEGVGRSAHKGKKGRKRGRKQSDLERDLQEAEAGPHAREAALLQSQMLEALFEVFFRVLKHCSTSISNPADTTPPAAAEQDADPYSGSSSHALLTQPWPAAKVHRRFPLLQPTLSGLGRYSHLISVDYFNDLMGVLQELLAAGALPVRERLCVLLAALEILRGQGEALTIDRRAFYMQLYNTLLLVPLGVLYDGLASSSSGSSSSKVAAAAADEEQELRAEVQQALDAVRISHLGWEALGSSGSGEQEQQQPTPVLLLRCLEQQLLGVKQTDMARLAAFVKRLLTLMLSVGVGEALGAACLVWRCMTRYPKLACLLEWEGGAPVGGQQYEPHCEDPSEAGALATALWELPLLSQHYHPHVAAAAKLLLGLTPGRAAAAAAAAAGEGEAQGAAGGGRGAAGTGVITGVLTGAMGPQQVAAAYENVSRGGFRPPPVMPPGLSGRARGGAGAAAGGSSKAQLAGRVAAAAGPLTRELQAAVQVGGGGGGGGGARAAARRPAGVSAAGAANGHVANTQQQQQQQLLLVQQQQQQLQQQEVVSTLDSVDMEAVQQAVQQQYVLSKQHELNKQLRRELALTAHKVERFRAHLMEKHQQRRQQQQHFNAPQQQYNKQRQREKHLKLRA